MLWYRQAPECMVREDKIHPGILWKAGIKKWGATLDGETVIRRSAIGINQARDILYVSITNHTNARVLAEGMRHAGAVEVAQLDVNWSYPKFVLFESKTAGRTAQSRRARGGLRIPRRRIHPQEGAARFLLPDAKKAAGSLPLRERCPSSPKSRSRAGASKKRSWDARSRA